MLASQEHASAVDVLSIFSLLDLYCDILFLGLLVFFPQQRFIKEGKEHISLAANRTVHIKIQMKWQKATLLAKKLTKCCTVSLLAKKHIILFASLKVKKMLHCLLAN